jgi:hypothetical protein
MTPDRLQSPPSHWSNDELIAHAESLAALWRDHEDGGESERCRVVAELAKRYRVAIEIERKRWANARAAFGEHVGPKGD